MLRSEDCFVVTNLADDNRNGLCYKGLTESKCLAGQTAFQGEEPT